MNEIPYTLEDAAGPAGRFGMVVLQSDETIGHTYALGGPEVLTWKTMLRRIAEATGRKKLILPMPIWIMRIGATLFDFLSFFPVTRGQLTMLEEGNTVDPKALRRLIGRDPRGFTVEALNYLN